MNETLNADPAVKEQMQKKLTGYIERKRARNKEMLAKIQQDSRLIYDYLVPPKEMKFECVGDNFGVELSFDENDKRQDLTLHNNAVTQLAQKLGIPTKYLKDLHNSRDPWKRFLERDILRYHTVNADQERVLVRAVGNQVRGVVSDSFKRINSIILYSTFMGAAKSMDCVVADAHYNDLSGYIEVVRPDVIAIPTENNGMQYVCFGVQFSNSDFGVKSLSMRAFNFVVRCENGWTTASVIRSVHLGARLPDNLELSKETYELETQTKASLVQDTIKAIMDPKKLYDYSVKIQEASKLEIDLATEVKALPQIGVLDSEIKSLETILMENDPNNNIGGGNTLFKLTQGLSAVSRESDDTRKRELDEITGKLFDRIKS